MFYLLPGGDPGRAFAFYIQQPEGTPRASTYTDALESVKAALVDPADWSALSNTVRTELVSRGPHQVKSDFDIPKREDKRSCNRNHFYRQLVNGGKNKRS